MVRCADMLLITVTLQNRCQKCRILYGSNGSNVIRLHQFTHIFKITKRRKVALTLSDPVSSVSSECYAGRFATEIAFSSICLSDSDMLELQVNRGLVVESRIYTT